MRKSAPLIQSFIASPAIVGFFSFWESLSLLFRGGANFAPPSPLCHSEERPQAATRESFIRFFIFGGWGRRATGASRRRWPRPRRGGRSSFLRLHLEPRGPKPPPAEARPFGRLPQSSTRIPSLPHLPPPTSPLRSDAIFLLHEFDAENCAAGSSPPASRAMPNCRQRRQ